MNPTSLRTLLIPVTILVAAMVSIQTGAAMAKHLLPVLGASGTATLRLCIAAFILCLIYRPWRMCFSHSSLTPLFLYGFSMGFMNVLIYMALIDIPLGIAVALEFTGPLAVAIWASHRPVDFIWILLAGAGVLVLLPAVDSEAALPLRGILCALGAGICWALYIIFGKKAGMLAPSGIVTATGMTIAAMAVTPLGVVNAGSDLIDPQFWPLAIVVACLSSALPYCLEMVALKRLPARTFGVLMSMEPAIAALSGLVVLNERLSLLQWGAVACIMLASAGAVFGARQPAATPEMAG